MSREHDETDLEQLLRRNRPAPPPPPAGEYARILAAARGETATASASGFFRYMPWALAATFVIALAATFIMDDGRPTAASGARDERVEAFLSDTIGEVMKEQPEQAVSEPLNGWNTFIENGGR